MADQIILFVKGRSYNQLDLLEFFKRSARITIGYIGWKEPDPKHPAWSKIAANLGALYQEVLPPREATKDARLGKSARGIIAFNAKLEDEMKEGGYVVIPRPATGRFWIGKVDSDFTIFDDNPAELFIADEKKKIESIAATQEEPKDFTLCNLYGQVLQGWKLKNLSSPGESPVYLREVPLVLVPSVIRKAMASRRSHGRVSIPGDKRNRDITVNVIEGLLACNQVKTSGTTMLEKLRLDFTPSSFEHLCVDILNCESKGEYWIHVGGAGDGGIDGAAFNSEGELVGVLQCKYQSNKTPNALIKDLKNSFDELQLGNAKIYLASLWDGEKWSKGNAPTPKGDGVTVWGGDDIAKLCEAHKHRIPVVSSMIRRSNGGNSGDERS